ncbi:MAG: hypothetical protein Tsb0019_13060 [Roseibium sp.]
MQTQRKQFGKRGLAHQTGRNRGAQLTAYGTAAAYTSPGYSAASADDDSFSISKVFGFAFGMLFSFRGRIGRTEYWSIGIVRFIIFLVAIFGFVTTLPPTAGSIDTADVMRHLVSSQSGLLCSTLLVTLTICLFSLEVRRLHDRDVSGLWVLLLFVPFIGGLYGLWLFIANGFFPGTPGTNRFDTAHSQASVFD